MVAQAFQYAKAYQEAFDAFTKASEAQYKIES
jgi:hypothetical protein